VGSPKKNSKFAQKGGEKFFPWAGRFLGGTSSLKREKLELNWEGVDRVEDKAYWQSRITKRKALSLEGQVRP